MQSDTAMAPTTSIEWTQSTWNPVTGCSKVSPGCAHCYAEALSLWRGWSKKTWTPANAAENVILQERRLHQPLSWRQPRMVFVNSMSDLFHARRSDDVRWLCYSTANYRIFAVNLTAERTLMPKFTVQLSGKMDDLLTELAREQGIPKTQVIRRSLGLLKFLNDEQKAGNKIAVTKDDQVVKEIVPA